MQRARIVVEACCRAAARRRLQLSTALRLPPLSTQVEYGQIKEIRSAPRAFGLWGETTSSLSTALRRGPWLHASHVRRHALAALPQGCASLLTRAGLYPCWLYGACLLQATSCSSSRMEAGCPWRGLSGTRWVLGSATMIQQAASRQP